MKRVLMCVVLIAWSTMASAVVYKWVDAQGKTQYGDRPPDGVHAEVVEGLPTHGTHPASAPQAASASKAPDAPTTTPSEVKKAVDTDVAATRQKQCAEAQERYKKLIEGRHIYKTGDSGERVYLSAEQIDEERLGAKKDIDDVCNSAS